MRQQGYGVSGWGVGPRRGLPRVRRARHLDRHAALKEQILLFFLPRRGWSARQERWRTFAAVLCSNRERRVSSVVSFPLGKAGN